MTGTETAKLAVLWRGDCQARRDATPARARNLAILSFSTTGGGVSLRTKVNSRWQIPNATNGGRNATTAHLLIPPSRSLARI